MVTSLIQPISCVTLLIHHLIVTQIYWQTQQFNQIFFAFVSVKIGHLGWLLVKHVVWLNSFYRLDLNNVWITTINSGWKLSGRTVLLMLLVLTNTVWLWNLKNLFWISFKKLSIFLNNFRRFLKLFANNCGNLFIRLF